jgi:hypothetical protein
MDPNELKKGIQLVKSEELLSRFRSKTDLYRYLTHQSKSILKIDHDHIVGLYLPSYDCTRLAFIRAILSGAKKVIKQIEVKRISVPKYEELSVKNLYDDAMNDHDLSQYLPDRDQLSNKLPERDFFFGILGTIKQDYLNQIIDHAEKSRYKPNDQGKKSDAIMITDEWLQELIKHPFISSNIMLLIRIEKPGKAIYLIKERSRLVRSKKSHTKHELGSRLNHSIYKNEEMKDESQIIAKRKKLNDGSYDLVYPQSTKKP